MGLVTQNMINKIKKEWEKSSSYLVGLLADFAAERFAARVAGLVFVQQGGATECLLAEETLVELLRVALLDVLPVILKRGEAQTTLLTVIGLCDV